MLFLKKKKEEKEAPCFILGDFSCTLKLWIIPRTKFDILTALKTLIGFGDFLTEPWNSALCACTYFAILKCLIWFQLTDLLVDDLVRSNAKRQPGSSSTCINMAGASSPQVSTLCDSQYSGIICF